MDRHHYQDDLIGGYMKHQKIITTLVLSSMLLAQGAFAQGFPGRGGPGPGPQDGWDQHRGWRDGPHHDNGNHYGYGRRGGNTQYVIIDDRRGAGPRHDMYRGGYLPRDYRSRQYVVDDWRDYRLAPPPRGYHWVQVGGDYVLAAIATGLIMQILLDH